MLRLVLLQHDLHGQLVVMYVVFNPRYGFPAY